MDQFWVELRKLVTLLQHQGMCSDNEFSSIDNHWPNSNFSYDTSKKFFMTLLLYLFLLPYNTRVYICFHVYTLSMSRSCHFKSWFYTFSVFRSCHFLKSNVLRNKLVGFIRENFQLSRYHLKCHQTLWKLKNNNCTVRYLRNLYF